MTCQVIEQRPEEIIPIGQPIDHVSIKILGEEMREVEIGEMGQLWIGGVQLAKGYLNDPEQTEKAFRPNPFSEIPGSHIYATGDLAVKRPDGSFEYRGRIDSQIKLRGFRIELGEIEAVLNKQKQIVESAVVAVTQQNGQTKLMACLAGNECDDKEVLDNLRKVLPSHMIPHRIKWYSRLPKTLNGKLDQKN